jgi:signal transduction histidine kinase
MRVLRWRRSVRAVTTSRQYRWPRWGDPAIAVGVVLLGVVELATVEAPLVQHVAAAIAGGVLAWRRRAPLAVLSAAVAVLLVQEVLGLEVDYGYTPLSLVIAFYSVAAHRRLQLAVLGLVGGVAALAVGSAIEGQPLFDFAFPLLLVAAPWAAGAALRARIAAAVEAESRARRAEEQQERRAAEAVAEERARIARELHDVVAHSVTIMVMQAGALRRTLPAGEARARELAETIEGTGREALAEMRRMLGLLHTGDTDRAPLTPQPGLARIGELVDNARAAGLAVELSVNPAPAALPPGLDVCVYRIVQEALTNVIKHAGAAAARVAVCFPPGRVELEITDDGRGGPTRTGGHGLAGMRERVALFNGQLQVGQREAGGFAVHAVLPVEAS